MPKLSYAIILLALFASLPALQAQRGKAQPSPSVDLDPSELPVLRGELDVRKMAQENRDFRQKAVQRILEIDAIIEPLMAQTAAELFKITPEEYEFLRLQANSSNSAQALKKTMDGIDYDELLQLLDYFDAAYVALQNGQYWIGQEESLIPKDQELYQAMQKEVEKALSATDEGRKALALIVEREELVEKLSQPKPVLEYFVERRKWWDAFPQYKETLKKTKQEEILQHLYDY
jgi:hypothetical protein